MDAILRAAAIYVVLMVIFRVSGKRTLAQITSFDLVLLLIVAQATQYALLGRDYSVTMAALVILTLVGLDRVSDYLGWRWRRLGRIIDGTPVILIERGQQLPERMREHHIGMDDVLEQGRLHQGVRSVEEIDYAILERSGVISIIPKRG